MRCNKCEIVHSLLEESEVIFCPLHNATPDLLKACQALIAQIKKDYWHCPCCLEKFGHGDDCLFGKVEELTHTAVAKATGGQNDEWTIPVL